MNSRALISATIGLAFSLNSLSAQSPLRPVKRVSETGTPIQVAPIPANLVATRSAGVPAGARTTTPIPGAMPIAIRPFEGQNGAVITQHLQAALNESHTFQLMNGGNGLPVVTGRVAPSFVEGTLIGPNGKSIFSRRYDSGNPRMDARRFADDVTLRLTKRRGIASSQIAFVAPRGNSQSPEICLSDADGNNLRQLTQDGRSNRAPSISADGSRIVYTATGNGQATLLLYDMVDGSLTPLTQTPAAHAVGALSPEGDSVIMAAGASPQEADLFLISVKSGKSQQLTATPNAERSPAWAPDGESIVFSASDASGQSSLYRMSLGRKAQAEPLQTGLAGAASPCWSPDGKRIAFSAIDPSNRLSAVFVLELENGQVRKLAAGSEPAWGADSRHVAYVGKGGLHLIDTFSGTSRQIVGNLGQITNPTWTR